jgi:ribosomal protein S27E
MPAKKKKQPKAAEVVDEDEKPVARNVKRRKDCPDCGSINVTFDPETEQLICQDCGLIFEELPEDMAKPYQSEEDELI